MEGTAPGTSEVEFEVEARSDTSEVEVKVRGPRSEIEVEAAGTAPGPSDVEFEENWRQSSGKQRLSCENVRKSLLSLAFLPLLEGKIP